MAPFARQPEPADEPARVLVMTDKALLHADSARHLDDGIALNQAQYQMLPGVIARPSDVYWDSLHANLVYVRRLDDGSVVYLAVTPDKAAKKIGRIDALVNAYRLPPGKDGADRLLTVRYVLMGEGAP